MRDNLLVLLVRRSPAAAVFPLLAAIAFYGCLRSQPQWLGDWAQTSLHIRNSLVFSAPALAALGAWVGNAEARHGIGHLRAVSAVPAWRRLGLTWAAAALWGLAAYTVAAVTTLMASMSGAGWGQPSVPLLAAGALACLTYFTFGVALGRLWTSLLAVPLAAVVSYGSGLAALENWTSPWRHLVPYNDDVITDGTTYRTGLLLAQCVWLTGLLALFTLVALCRGRAVRPRPALAAGAAALVLLVSGAAAATGQGGDFVRRQDMALDDLACAGTGPAVCLHPSRTAQLPAAQRAIRRVASAFRGVPGLPGRYVEAGVLAWTPADTLEFPLGDRGIDEYQVAVSVLDQMLYRAPCAGRPTAPGGPARGTVIEVWFLERNALDPGTRSAAVGRAVADLDAMPAQRRTQFLQDSLSASAQRCGEGSGS